MTLNFKIIFLFLTFLGTNAWSETNCPWENLSGEQMAQFSFQDDQNTVLTAQQVREDLACLKILFENKYVGQEDYPQINLIERLQTLSASAGPMKSSQLLDSIYSLHKGLPDVHLAYRANGITKQYSGSDGQQVEINETLESEKVYDRGTYVYFKPAKILDSELTTAQQAFVKIVKTEDRNLVIDLRETHGGGGPFPEELAKNIFTASQPIPKAATRQVKSGLVYIGLGVTAMMVYGEEKERARYDKVKNYVKEMSFKDLIAFTIEEKIEEFIGVRPKAYQSKIFLLIDRDCASECETIIEKLNVHPNVVTVGANTRGAVHYSNALTFVLPHSGILTRIPSLRHVYENDMIEGIGYAPMIKMNFIDLGKLAY